MSRIAAALLIVLSSWNLTAQESRPASPPVATIDGHPVTRDELVRHLLELHEATVVEALIVDAVLDLELEKAGFKRSESDAGWDDLQGLEKPESLPSWPNTPQGRRERFIRAKVGLYDVAKRGGEVAPPAGLVAEVRQKEGTASRQITPEQAVTHLVETKKWGGLREAAGALVDRLLIDRELARAGKPVTDAEVDAWEASMRKKYPPPFDWTMICRFKGTTPQRERARWRTVEAWKRLTGWRLDEKELETFHEQNRERFSGKQESESQPVITRDLGDPSYRSWVVEQLEQKHLGFWLAAVRAKSRIWIAPDDDLVRILKAK